MLKGLIKDIFRGSAIRPAPKDSIADASGNADRWLELLIGRMFGLMHSFEADNFDASRYRNEPANAFFHDRHSYYFKFLLKNVGHFYHARALLEDQVSRELFDQLILFRILGHLHVRLPFNTEQNRMHLSTAESWHEKDTEDIGPFGPLSIYLVPGPGDLRVKGWKENVTWTFLYRQYYFERNGMKIQPQAGDRVIDAGGCFGDTALGFADAVGERGHVYIFDPLPKHCAIIRQTKELNPALGPRMTIYPFGLSDTRNDVAPLPEDNRIDPGARVVAAEMPMTTIDEVVFRDSIPRIDFIKMDIEGSELGALRGAEATIRRDRPKLGISLYHRPEDFFTIPSWIDSLDLGYRFFLEHYSIHHEETVLFAAIKDGFR
jgi:FkbM family methyltransferase